MNDGRRVNAPVERSIYGVHAVERRLRVRPSSVRSVWLGAGVSQRRREIADLARQHGIAVRECDEAALRRLSGTDAHQGVAAQVEPFAYCDLAALTGDGRAILVLDQIQDPQNFGALLRTATAAGFAGAIVPERGAVGVTAAVEKAAAGATNDIGVCRVVNLARSLEQLADAGYWRVALVPGGGPSLFAAELPAPTALVLGGESGIRRLVLERCDLRVSIPQVGPVQSLNASVAGAVAMYEVLRRQTA